MTRRTRSFQLSLLALLSLVLAMPVAAQDEATAAPTEPAAPPAIPAGEGPYAQGVFFFSPTCGHCEYVITNTLPVLFADNGGDYAVTYDETVLPDPPAFYLMSNGVLQLLMVDTSTELGGAMFQADSERLEIERAGVPRIDFNEIDYLVGSGDIPSLFPGVVADTLAAEGMSWPPVPGLAGAIAPFIEEGSVVDPDVVPSGEAEATADGSDEVVAVLPFDGGGEGWADRFGQDLAGNSISVIVLALLLLSVIAVPILALRGAVPAFPVWTVIALVIVGIVVAVYLASVETTGGAAVCGPVGDCNTVQQSQYAKLMGVPIGVLGAVGYAALGGLWVVSRVAHGTLADSAGVLIGVGAWSGSLFSVYLTFLEPFVIGATCMWCITSALVMTALLWTSAGRAADAWHRLRGQPPRQATARV